MTSTDLRSSSSRRPRRVKQALLLGLALGWAGTTGCGGAAAGALGGIGRAVGGVARGAAGLVGGAARGIGRAAGGVARGAGAVLGGAARGVGAVARGTGRLLFGYAVMDESQLKPGAQLPPARPAGTSPVPRAAARDAGAAARRLRELSSAPTSPSLEVEPGRPATTKEPAATGPSRRGPAPRPEVPADEPATRGTDGDGYEPQPTAAEAGVGADVRGEARRT